MGILVTGVITVAFIRGQGAITGTDFSPTHFTTRHYSFIEIPWIGLQITPIRRVDTTSDALQYLRTSGMIPRLRPNQKTWHPSTIRRGFSTTVQHDSQLLIDQLALTDQSKPYWEQWSIDHPEKARVLWPLIAKLAQRELYVLMPGIFNLAQRQKSDERFSDQLDRYLTQEYAELVSDMRAAGRLDLAEQLEREAKELYASPTKN